jgi:MoxR-like ATPase
VTVAAREYDEQLAQVSAHLDRLVRRLQCLSALAWTSRRDPVLRCLARLVELDGLAERRPMPPLPDLASFSLADAITVVTGDVLAALAEVPNVDVLDRVFVELGAALAATR